MDDVIDYIFMIWLIKIQQDFTYISEILPDNIAFLLQFQV